MKKHPDEEIVKEHRGLMNALANALDEMFNSDGPKKICFALLLTEFGASEGGRVNYISNGSRDDMRIMLKELLARWEGQPEQKGTA